jgi:hypothetical protein
MKNWIRGAACVMASATLVAGCATLGVYQRDFLRCGDYVAVPALPAIIAFTNGSSDVIRLYWVKGPDQPLVHYADLSPGQVLEQRTWLGHFWMGKRPDGSVAGTTCAQHETGAFRFPDAQT